MYGSPGQVMTTVRTSMDTSDFSTYQIIAFAIIFLIVASIIYYTKDFMYYEWKKLFNKNELTGETIDKLELNNNSNSLPSTTLDYSKMATSPKINDLPSSTTSSELASSTQTWCLVGEDSAGRWCIQVESSKHCDKARSYKTKNQCEQDDSPKET